MTDYTLYYWPIPFRGHLLRFVLAHVGAIWTEPDFAEMAAFKDRPVGDKPYPFLAPPLLHDHENDTWLNQMPAIAMYLGRKHNLIHDPDQTLRIACDAADILLEITRGHGAQMWDREAWNAFITQRLPLWMRLHERLILNSGVTADEGFCFGADQPGLADLLLAGLWHTMAERLPGMRALLHETAPTVEGLADRIAATPRIAALIDDWRDSDWRYCAGQIENSLMSMLTEGTET